MECDGGMEGCRNADMQIPRYVGRCVNTNARMHVHTYVRRYVWVDEWMDWMGGGAEGEREGWMDVRTYGCI